MLEEEPCKNVHRICIHNSWKGETAQTGVANMSVRCVGSRGSETHEDDPIVAPAAGRGSVSVNWSTLPSPPSIFGFSLFTLYLGFYILEQTDKMPGANS